MILNHNNFWQYLKAKLEKDSSSNPSSNVMKKNATEEGSLDKPLPVIIKQLGLLPHVDILGSPLSTIKLSEKVFEKELKDQIKDKINTAKKDMEKKIKENKVVTNIDALLQLLEQCKTDIDNLVEQVANKGKETLREKDKPGFKGKAKGEDDKDAGFD